MRLYESIKWDIMELHLIGLSDKSIYEVLESFTSNKARLKKYINLVIKYCK